MGTRIAECPRRGGIQPAAICGASTLFKWLDPLFDYSRVAKHATVAKRSIMTELRFRSRAHYALCSVNTYTCVPLYVLYPFYLTSLRRTRTNSRTQVESSPILLSLTKSTMPRSDADEADGGDSTGHELRTSAAERSRNAARTRQRQTAIHNVRFEVRGHLETIMGQTTYEGRQLQHSLVDDAATMAASELDDRHPASAPIGSISRASLGSQGAQETVRPGHTDFTTPSQPPSTSRDPDLQSEISTQPGSALTEVENYDGDFSDTDRGGQRLIRQTQQGSTQRSGQDGAAGKKGI